jgi:hypothetical protein
LAWIELVKTTLVEPVETKSLIEPVEIRSRQARPAIGSLVEPFETALVELVETRFIA